MSKRKRAPKPGPGEPTEDAGVKEDMVHVTPDLLSGSPDIFASKKPAGEEAETTEAAEAAETPEPPDTVSEPDEPEPPAPTEMTEATTEPMAEAAPAPAAEPPVTPAPFVEAVPYPARPRRGGSSAALGVVLVVVGLFALLVSVLGWDLTQNGWPLFIIVPGLTLLVAGFTSFGSLATIPGGIVTMLGVVLAYASGTGHWAVLAYAWTLVLPGGIGLGMYLQALRDRDQHDLRTGRTLLLISAMMFLIGFVLFESILGISGRDTFGLVGKAALPALLIIVGIILFVRSVQRSRQA